MTEFDELVGLLDDDDALTEEQSTAKKPRLKSPMSLFSHKKKDDAETPKPAKKSPMASMKSKFSFGKKKAHDEAEEVEESEAEEEPAGPSESLETREQASHKTPAKTPAKSPPLPARPSSTKKSPPLPPRPSSTKKTDVPAPVVVEEDAPIPAAPASTPDGPRKSGAMLDDESESDDEAASPSNAGEAADRVGPLSPLTPAPEPTPQKTVEDDIAAESVTTFSP